MNDVTQFQTQTRRTFPGKNIVKVTAYSSVCFLSKIPWRSDITVITMNCMNNFEVSKTFKSQYRALQVPVPAVENTVLDQCTVFLKMNNGAI